MTPHSRMELDTSIDQRSKLRISTLKTGTPLDKNKDDRQDMVKCEGCGRMFKKRGIKIHHAKSECGSIVNSSSSSRRVCKSPDNQPLEANHSGEVVQTGRRRRLPFIVSVTSVPQITSDKIPRHQGSTSADIVRKVTRRVR